MKLSEKEMDVIAKYVRDNIGDAPETLGEYMANAEKFEFLKADGVKNVGANLAYAESLHSAGVLIRVTTPVLQGKRCIGFRNSYMRHLS